MDAVGGLEMEELLLSSRLFSFGFGEIASIWKYGEDGVGVGTLSRDCFCELETAMGEKDGWIRKMHIRHLITSKSFRENTVDTPSSSDYG